MGTWKLRRDAPFPFQEWREFPPEAIVLARNTFGDRRIAQAKDLWWGYELDCGTLAEGVITAAMRLDRPKQKSK